MDADDQIYAATIDGTVHVHDSDGSHLQTYADKANAIAVDPNGTFGMALVGLIDDQLVGFDTEGDRHVLGTGFTGPNYDLAFGPDDVLYISELTNNRILRVIPRPAAEVVNVVTHGFRPFRRRATLPWEEQHWEEFSCPYVALGDTLEQLGQQADVESQSYVPEWDSTRGWREAAHAFLSAYRLTTPLSEIANASVAWHMAAAHRTAVQTASQVFEDITTSGLLDDPADEQRINLVGHSRGAAVNARLSQLLTVNGYDVDQFVALDGYSTDWPEGTGALGDISIVENATAHRTANYRVEQDLIGADATELLERFFGFSIPITTDLDWRAPNRVGFENQLLAGQPRHSFSNHENIVDLYMRSADRGLPSEQQHLLDDFTNLLDERSGDVEGETIVTTPGDPVPQFFDGTFEQVGALNRDIQSHTFPTDDEVVAAWLELVDTPDELLRINWGLSGSVELTADGSNDYLRVGTDGIAGQNVRLDQRVSALQFDVRTRVRQKVAR